MNLRRKVEREDHTANLAMPRRRPRPSEQMDTRGLPQSKIHPDRNDAYRQWLTKQPCAVAGKVDSATDQVHVCWHPKVLRFEKGKPVFASDPAHAGKAYSGKLKRNDSQCMPLCRHAHDLQEDNHEKFDRRFGIDRFAVAADHFTRFLAEQERF